MRLFGLLEKMYVGIFKRMHIHQDEELHINNQLYMFETITKIYRLQKNIFMSGELSRKRIESNS